MESRRRKGRDRQRFEGEGAQYLVEMGGTQRMSAIHDGQDHRFNPTPSPEHMCRVGWDEVVKKRSDLQAS
jgi:hypothetical protein